ncbi:MAG TPA: Crp/Fnr family transcriptional regulator, partial [Usitatibacter sp.]|nr:Crp/Fnr family transcriptional regulator [Usitatibacter sp.]
MPITNRLLDRLPAKDRARVLDACDAVVLEFPTVVAEPGEAIRHVYFPTGSFISLVAPMGGRDSLEVALAGSEGLFGVGVALGVDISPVHALVQGGGAAWRIGVPAFRRELARIPSLRDCVDRYAYVVMSQLIQTSGCNRFHVVEQRLARWLLMTSDRAHSTSFHITHEFLAYMLGVRRVGITEAASDLQGRNLIGYSRGAMTIRN